MITIDYHSHHNRCGHATGTIEDYVRAAINKELTEFGISDHCPAYYLEGNDPIPGLAMAKDELDGYVEEVTCLQQKYAGTIAIKLGLEVDYFENLEDVYRQKLAPYPWDYLLGSVHHVFAVGVYERRRWDTDSDPVRTFAEYYRLVKQSAHSGMFDILSHTSAIHAYAHTDPAAAQSLQDDALQTIRDCGVAIEINTSGYRKMTSDPFPTIRMIGQAASLGIPITFGSDAHLPTEVAYHRDQVDQLLARFGIVELATFTQRQRHMLAFTPTAIQC